VLSRSLHYKGHSREFCLLWLRINLTQKEKASSLPVNKKFSAASANWPAHCAVAGRLGAGLLRGHSVGHGVPKGGGLPAMRAAGRELPCAQERKSCSLKRSQLCQQAAVPGLYRGLAFHLKRFWRTSRVRKDQPFGRHQHCEQTVPDLKTFSMLFPP